MQTPTPVETSFLQTIMPELTLFVIGCLVSLGLIVRAYAAKIVSQLQTNHAASEAIAAQASTAATAAGVAATEAKTAAASMAQHTTDAGEKLDDIAHKVNGAMTALQEKSDTATATLLAAKDQQIAALKDKSA